MPVLHLDHLTVDFHLDAGTLRAVDDVSFAIEPGEIFGVVGESGSGKSVTALSIMRLLDPRARVTNGHIWFEGADLLEKPESQMRKIRGRKISMIFQEPMTSLNPAFSVGEQVSEVLREHTGLGKGDARRRTVELFENVQIPRANQMYGKYPFEFSGGMRQRVMIAMALACQPSLVIADEPTTALDVTIQAQILAILQELQRDMKMALMFISHNLEVIAQICDRVAVMYASRLMEVSETDKLFRSPAHPYTEGLLRSIPRRGQPLHSIPGTIPNLLNIPSGCPFNPRCEYAQERCSEETPQLLPPEGLESEERDPRLAACHFPLTANTEKKVASVS